ncbi:excinuclease ABC subunit C [Mycoplasmopsis mucosicanis]|uniref:Excinuclease ABC subunit C n=1 Tax=Mycoplasmopsis mucosicanis TaxID=458208 RepID=A0A507SY84_9BACT|nr:GIY-YIG nuclease family protein [Mycoplasmopsis mucosicanis]TQC54193.1 excinuclease ABC subunit C [Mycoplasmopsis mucosicanis]
MSNFIKEKLKTVPKLPGVYLWKDAENTVIYVGKAKNLNRRMNQYLEGSINSYKTHAMVQKISDFEIFIVRNDKEALLLEKQFIEKYNPEFNILLLDDRRYPYIKVELKNGKLDILIVRKITKKESSSIFYFGPFPQGYGAGVILKLLQREAFFENGLKISNTDIEFWKQKFQHIKNIITFQKKYIQELRQKMLQASNKLQFEIALDIKNSLQYLEKISQEQIIELKNFQNIDVFAFKIIENKMHLTVLFYRHGNLIGNDNLSIDLYIDEYETLLNLFNAYYLNTIKPDAIILDNNLEHYNFQNATDFKFIFPKSGNYEKIMQLAYLNLEQYCSKNIAHIKSIEEKNFTLTKELSKYTNGKLCSKIIAFDNSNYANTLPVGVAVAYVNGLKNKHYYRKFNHFSIESRHSDVEYMRQSALKYFTNLEKNLTPDLIIADGGLAQVHEVKRVLKELNLNFSVIGLIKDNYHRTSKIVDVNEKTSIIKPQNLKNFLAAIQIEVDRFAKSHYHNHKKISSLEGKLQRIKGLGEKYEQKLLQYFKTYTNIYNASFDQLCLVVPKNIAKKIFDKEYLKGD